MTEDQFQTRILELAAYLGLLVFHDHDSRRNTAGFPDLVIVGGQGVLFRELKTDVGRVRPEQNIWISRLALARQDVGVWRPRDWDRVTTELRAIR